MKIKALRQKIFRLKARIVDIVDYSHSLEQRITYLEGLQPHWVKGYSSDSVAAQQSTSSLVQLHKVLGVKDQTDAMGEIKELHERCDEYRRLLNVMNVADFNEAREEINRLVAIEERQSSGGRR